MPAPSREVSYMNSFDGGLNLTDQTQSLLPNQSPDCLNVDFGIRKGFMLRGGFRHQETDERFNGAHFLGFAEDNDYVLLCSADGDLLRWNGADLVDTGVAVTEASSRTRMADHNGSAYIANGRFGGTNPSDIVMNRWDGQNLVALGDEWDENHVVPSGSNMPKAMFVNQWRGYMWAANTFEDGVHHTNRLRFSHLQFPESWSKDDYFDIGDSLGSIDPIMGVHPFRDQLFIFKKGEVWVLSGDEPDNFALNPLTISSGTCSCGASDSSSGILYWFSTDGRLMAYNGTGITVLSQPIQYWSDVGRIQQGGAHRLMWADGRLWLSLEAGPAAQQERFLFIWSPAAKAFTLYDRQVRDMIFWKKIGFDADPLFLDLGSDDIFRYDQSYETDSSGDNPSIRIDGHYRTAWVSEGETATKKRWKRPRVTAAATESATIQLEVFHDMQDLDPKRQVSFPILPDTATSRWDSMVWDSDVWAGLKEETYAFKRTPSAGSAHTVSFKFSSTDNVGRWWVDSIAVPFRRKQVR